MVVDANAGVTTAKMTIAEIKKLTPKPVRFVVNTHWHDDHVMGNQAYADAYPGDQFVAHPLTRQDIIDHAFANNAFVMDLLSSDITRIGGYLETGIGRDGKPMTPDQRIRARSRCAFSGAATPAATSWCRAARSAGLTLEQATDKIQLADVRDQMTGNDKYKTMLFEEYFRKSLIKRVWQEQADGSVP